MRLQFILYLIIISPNFFLAQSTDLKEYGLNGRVKQMSALHYEDVKIVNGKWTPLDRDQYKYKSVTYFNKEGNIDSIINTRPDLEHPYRIKNEFIYENGLKIGGYSYDFNGERSQIYTIEWKTKRKYILTSKDVYGNPLFVLKSYLDRRFREKKSENIYYDHGKIIDHGKYKGYFDENGYLVKGKIYNLMKNEEHTTLYFHFGKDQFNNITNSVVINSTYGTDVSLMIRTIEYY